MSSFYTAGAKAPSLLSPGDRVRFLAARIATSLLIAKNPGGFDDDPGLRAEIWRARRFGINPGGVMDAAAAACQHPAFGNKDDVLRTVIETHFRGRRSRCGPERSQRSGGADLWAHARRLGEPIANWRPFFAGKGGVLRFAGRHWRQPRVPRDKRGGLKIKPWLGSASTNLAGGIGGFSGRETRRPAIRIDLPAKAKGERAICRALVSLRLCRSRFIGPFQRFA